MLRAVGHHACRAALVFACGLVVAGPSFEPDVNRATTAARVDGAWTIEQPGIVISIRLIDDATRQRFIERATGFEIDPFGTRPDQEPRFLTFLMEIDNRGSGTLLFQAQTLWLRAPGEVLSPIGIQALQSAYRTVELDMGRAYERAQPALFEGSTTVAPGETRAGLLVYKTVKAKTKRFHLELQMTLPDGELLRMHAPYRRLKKPSGKKERE